MSSPRVCAKAWPSSGTSAALGPAPRIFQTPARLRTSRARLEPHTTSTMPCAPTRSVPTGRTHTMRGPGQRDLEGGRVVGAHVVLLDVHRGEIEPRQSLIHGGHHPGADGAQERVHGLEPQRSRSGRLDVALVVLALHLAQAIEQLRRRVVGGRGGSTGHRVFVYATLGVRCGVIDVARASGRASCDTRYIRLVLRPCPRLPGRPSMGVDAVLARWLASSWVKPCFCADETLRRRRRAVRAPAPRPRAGARRGRCASAGSTGSTPTRRARSRRRAPGRHLVVATPTASGKSLCFHLPVLQALVDDPDARAIYLYPTKALARDQEAGLRELMTAAGARRRGGGLRRRHAGRRAARGARAGGHRPDEPGHAAHGDPAAPRELGAHAAAPALRRGRRASHVQGRLRLARGQRAPAPAARRALPRVDAAASSARRPPSATRARTRRGCSACAEDDVELARRERRAARRSGAFSSSTRRSSTRSSASARAT